MNGRDASEGSGKRRWDPHLSLDWEGVGAAVVDAVAWRGVACHGREIKSGAHLGKI